MGVWGTAIFSDERQMMFAMSTRICSVMVYLHRMPRIEFSRWKRRSMILTISPSSG